MDLRKQNTTRRLDPIDSAPSIQLPPSQIPMNSIGKLPDIKFKREDYDFPNPQPPSGLMTRSFRDIPDRNGKPREYRKIGPLRGGKTRNRYMRKNGTRQRRKSRGGRWPFSKKKVAPSQMLRSSSVPNLAANRRVAPIESQPTHEQGTSQTNAVVVPIESQPTNEEGTSQTNAATNIELPNANTFSTFASNGDIATEQTPPEQPVHFKPSPPRPLPPPLTRDRRRFREDKYARRFPEKLSSPPSPPQRPSSPPQRPSSPPQRPSSPLQRPKSRRGRPPLFQPRNEVQPTRGGAKTRNRQMRRRGESYQKLSWSRR